jgi:hypothetical protein
MIARHGMPCPYEGNAWRARSGWQRSSAFHDVLRETRTAQAVFYQLRKARYQADAGEDEVWMDSLLWVATHFFATY